MMTNFGLEEACFKDNSAFVRDRLLCFQILRPTFIRQ